MKNRVITTDDKIRISWAINNAVEWAKAGDRDFKRIKPIADNFLTLFDEMINELPEPPCQDCGGIEKVGGKGLNKDGMCETCETRNKFNLRDYTK